MSVKNIFTNESFQVPVDTRTTTYVRIVVFLSLALAWPFWAMKRGVESALGGFAVLILLIAFSLVLPLLQILGMVRVLGLGVLTQSAISVGILTLVTYPSMAFAVPGLVWLLTLQFTDSGAKPPAGASHRAAQGSSTP